jgi:ubiquinone/menaquinone biosynthesis C-methylase UbiE
MTMLTYETIWDDLARQDAREAILTGADEEKWESTGRSNADRVLELCTPDSIVLGIGCGAGRMEKYIAPGVAALHAVDISSEMIRLAKQRLAGQSHCYLYHIKPGEYLRRFPDGFFDVAYSYLVLQHLEREHAWHYLIELHRVLKPEGRASIQFPNLLSKLYTDSFIDQATLYPSPARVRCYTASEARHIFSLAHFEVQKLDFFPEQQEPEHLAISREMFFTLQNT